MMSILFFIVALTVTTSFSVNITINQEHSDDQVYTVRIHCSNIESLNQELYNEHLDSAALAILDYHKSTLTNGDSMLQNYESPQEFWHGRESEPSDIGPWFDDGFGDYFHLWTVIVSKYVQSIEWCLKYSSGFFGPINPILQSLKLKRIDFDLVSQISAGWIVVFETQRDTTSAVKILDAKHFISGSTPFAGEYEETEDIIARIFWPMGVSRKQAIIAFQNAFAGEEHPDSYVFTKAAQKKFNLSIQRKYKIIWCKAITAVSKL